MLLKNGDKLTGKIGQISGGKVTFDSPMLGEITIDLANVESWRAYSGRVKETLKPAAQPRDLDAVAAWIGRERILVELGLAPLLHRRVDQATIPYNAHKAGNHKRHGEPRKIVGGHAAGRLAAIDAAGAEIDGLVAIAVGVLAGSGIWLVLRPRSAEDFVQHVLLEDKYIFTPSLVLAASEVALITRIARTGILAEMNSDYVRVAQAKGLRPSVKLIDDKDVARLKKDILASGLSVSRSEADVSAEETVEVIVLANHLRRIVDSRGLTGAAAEPELRTTI